MITMNLNDEWRSLWPEIFRPITKLFRENRLKRTFGKLWVTASRKEKYKLQTAMLMVRMAAEPGDNYEMVAARIEREADSYQKFLNNPQPIGKVCLQVKQLPSEADDNWLAHRKYQVCDPAEGQASVSYTLRRSTQLVLEFLVYDEQDEFLFPIVRTYSDWIGKKKFNLGLNRTFHLNMMECSSPELVCVYAGFTPFTEQEVKGVQGEVAIGLQPAPVLTTENLSPRNDPFFQQFGRRMGLLMAAQSALLIVVFCSLLFWPRTVRQQPRFNNQTPSPQGMLPTANLTHLAEWSRFEDDDAMNVSPPETVRTPAPKEKNNPYKVLSVGDKERLSENQMKEGARMANIKKVGVSVDVSSCKETGNVCKELLTAIRKAIESDLVNWKLTTSVDKPRFDRGSARLIVSYKPVDSSFGHLYVTLVDYEGLLWGKTEDCHQFGGGNPETFASDSSEMFVRQLALDIKTAKQSRDNPGKDNKTGAAEKGTSQAE